QGPARREERGAARGGGGGGDGARRDRDAVDRRCGGGSHETLDQIGGDVSGKATERIAETSPTGGRHDDDVVPHEREGADLPRQRRRLDVGPGAPDVEPVRRPAVATAHTIGTQETLLGENGELGGRRQYADLAHESQPTAIAAGTAGVGPQLAALDPQRGRLL